MTQKNKMSTYTKGMEIRRQVLGNKHVENAIKNTNKIDLFGTMENRKLKIYLLIVELPKSSSAIRQESVYKALSSAVVPSQLL